MLTAFATGLLLGLSAGLAPGPLLALVLSQTLRHGAREGCKIALSPLITDAPIIAVTLWISRRVAETAPWLGIVSFAGSLFVLYLAWDSLRPARLPGETGTPMAPASWTKGIFTNLLSPHPWLFWLTVGAATLARTSTWTATAAFLLGFYLLLVGSKLALALLADTSRAFLAGRAYRIVMVLLATLLSIFAVLLFRDGLVHLGVI